MGTGGNNTPVPVTATNRMTAIGQYAEDDDSASTLMARDYKDAKDLVTESSVKPVMERTITHEVIGTLQSRMHKGVNHKGARDGHLIIETSLTLVEPQVFVKAKRAQNDQDDETWKTDAPHPTLNQFDQGDSRTVTAVVAPTLTAYNMDSRSPQSEESQRIVGTVHAVTGTVRRLTPTECERLQGFPDGWTEGQADSHRYKQMGNAVAVPVVEWIMQGIVEVMSDERK
jgi:site-specific DNA-cytosine methylase